MTAAALEVTLRCRLCGGPASEEPAENGTSLKTVCDAEQCPWSSLPYSKAAASNARRRAERDQAWAERQQRQRAASAAAVEQRYDIERDRSDG